MWQTRLPTLVPVIDVADDGHLYEWLDPPQSEAVFALLEQAPRESRSLREAMEAVEPGITKYAMGAFGGTPWRSRGYEWTAHPRLGASPVSRAAAGAS